MCQSLVFKVKEIIKKHKPDCTKVSFSHQKAKPTQHAMDNWYARGDSEWCAFKFNVSCVIIVPESDTDSTVSWCLLVDAGTQTQSQDT